MKIIAKVCPYYKGMCDDTQIAKDALSLINRQKAEIERLQELCGNADGYADALEAYTKEKAIKEFAERLKSVLIIYTYQNFDGVIDNLVKEMVGDE